MNIGEVSNITGLSSSNIRYYEQLDLIKPSRNPDNDYRVYSDLDIQKLQEIKLFRKLDISIDDIKKLHKGEITLDECMDTKIDKLEDENRNLEIRKKLCKELKSENTTLENIDTNLYLNKIENYEKEGIKFMSIANDFIEKVKDRLPKDSKYCFDPKKPIMTKEDFTNELFFFAQEENLELSIFRESMNPKVIIDGKKYIAVLEMPRMIKFPLSIFFAPHTYGYQAVYLYEWEEQ